MVGHAAARAGLRRRKSGPNLAPERSEKIEFGRVVETGQVITLLQAEDLPLGKVGQVGEDRHDLLPMVADPRQRKEHEALVIAAKSLQQALGVRATRAE